MEDADTSIAALLQADREIIEATRRIAEMYRDLLAGMVFYHEHPDEIEDVAVVEEEIKAYDNKFLTLPWETEEFDIRKKLKGEDNG